MFAFLFNETIPRSPLRPVDKTYIKEWASPDGKFLHATQIGYSADTDIFDFVQLALSTLLKEIKIQQKVNKHPQRKTNSKKMSLFGYTNAGVSTNEKSNIPLLAENQVEILRHFSIRLNTFLNAEQSITQDFYNDCEDYPGALEWLKNQVNTLLNTLATTKPSEINSIYKKIIAIAMVPTANEMILDPQVTNKSHRRTNKA